MKQMTKRALALGLALGMSTVAVAEIKPVDSIVVVVDNAVITRQDLNQAMSRLRAQATRGSQANEADLRQQALQELVTRSLLVQAAQRANVTVSETEIDVEAARVAAGRKLTVEQLYQRSAKDGTNRATLRRRLAEDLLVQKMQQNLRMENSRISDEEVDAAIARARQQGIALPQGEPSRQYHVQHLLLKGDNEPTRKLILQLQAQARSGMPFAQLARQYSQDGSAAAGGDLGWIEEGQTVPPFEAAVKALKPGQISQPVHSQFGWHIIRLVEVRSNDTPEQRQRSGMRNALIEERSTQALNNLLRQLHEQAFIQVRER